MTTIEQAVGAPFVIEGVVSDVQYRLLDDGYPVTDVVLTARRSWYPGASRLEVLRLPGGMKDGAFVHQGYDRLDIGASLLVFARRADAGFLVLLGAEQSFFKRTEPEGVVTDGRGIVIMDPGCVDSRLIARSAGERPVPVGEPLPPAPEAHVFVDKPADYGMDWPAFLDSIDACVVQSTGGSR